MAFSGFYDGMRSDVAVRFSLSGGIFRVRLSGNDLPGHRHGRVLDDDGNEIGDAHDLIYGSRGFSIWTRPFAGFVPIDQIEFV